MKIGSGNRRFHQRLFRGLPWLVLGLVAALHVGFNGIIFFGDDDSENMETPLAAAAADQFTLGPHALYGPYGPKNPNVIILSPLYFRLTGLLAIPLVRAGYSPLDACLRTGRLISLVSYSGLLAVCYHLARQDDLPRSAGFLAVLLILSTRLFDSYVVMVRPDLLAAFLQSLGLFWVLRFLANGVRRRITDFGCLVPFALAACCKIHFLGTGGLSTLLLIGAWVRKRQDRRTIETALLLGAGTLVAYYFAEQVATRGMMSRSVLAVPLELRSLATVRAINAWFIFKSIGYRTQVLLALVLSLLLIYPRTFRGSRADRLIWFFLALEGIQIAVMAYGNAGAWVNLALPAATLLSVNVARALYRLSLTPGPRGLLAVPVAALGIALAHDISSMFADARFRVYTDEFVRSLLSDPRLAGGYRRDSIYFAALPQCNRRAGRIDLIHDEFAYGLLERAGIATPRSYWLKPLFVSGPIRTIVVPEDPPFPMVMNPPHVCGLSESLPDLGYKMVFQLGRFQVWQRARLPSPNRARLPSMKSKAMQ